MELKSVSGKLIVIWYKFKIKIFVKCHTVGKVASGNLLKWTYSEEKINFWLKNLVFYLIFYAEYLILLQVNFIIGRE